MRITGTRARVALGLLLAMGLGTSSFAATTPRGARRAPAPARQPAVDDTNRVLVRIGRETITRGDLQRRIDDLPEMMRANYATPETRLSLLQRMVEEKVWLMAATRHGVPERKEIKRQLEQQRRDLVLRTYLGEIMAASPAASDSEARAYYDAHLSDYRVPATVTLSHILCRSEADAKRVLQWARGKQDWKKLVARYSADTLTRASGGSLGTVTREGVFATIGSQPALAESALALGEGTIGGPFHTERGWHVIRVDAVKLEGTRPFEQARSVILRQLGSQRSQDFYQARLAETRAALGVTADSAAIKSFSGQKKTARDLFRDAQEAQGASRRIELYQKLLEQYPDSDVSPQAQFMVGFTYSEELKDYDQAEKAFRELLRRYPKSELVASAQWMVDHMRSADAPSFLQQEADSSRKAAARARATQPSTGKP